MKDDRKRKYTQINMPYYLGFEYSKNLEGLMLKNIGKIRYGLIAAGGSAQRFGSYSLTLPKEMLPIGGIPVIEYSIRECLNAGVTRIIIVTRSNNTVIKQHLQVSDEFKESIVEEFTDKPTVQINIIPEDSRLKYGNAAPLLTVRQLLINQTFYVLFADDVIFGKNALEELEQMHNKMKKKLVSIVGFQEVPISEVHNYGNIEVNEQNEIIKLRQKPHENIISNKVVVSRLLLNGNIYKYIREENGKELDLGEALKRQLTSNRNEVYACHLSGTWACVDTPEKYLEAQKIFMCMNGKINY